MALLDVFKKGKKKEKEVSAKKKVLATKSSEKMQKAVNIYSAAYKNLLKPVVSEKCANLNISNKYVFQVKKSASKNDIAKAIFAVYGIKPVKVNVINLSGKSRRYGRSIGKTIDKKKAIVTLPAGKSIKIYEGV